jgi:hypothetical protein
MVRRIRKSAGLRYWGFSPESLRLASAIALAATRMLKPEVNARGPEENRPREGLHSLALIVGKDT